MSIEHEWQLYALPWWQRWPAWYGAGKMRLPALKPAESAARGLQRLMRLNKLNAAAVLPAVNPGGPPSSTPGALQPLCCVCFLDTTVLHCRGVAPSKQTQQFHSVLCAYETKGVSSAGGAGEQGSVLTTPVTGHARTAPSSPRMALTLTPRGMAYSSTSNLVCPAQSWSNSLCHPQK